MLKLLEIILREMGYQPPHPINGDNSLFTEFVIKKDTFNVICSVKIHNGLLYSESLDKSIQNKLTTLLFNNIWFKNSSEITKDKLEEFIEENYPSDKPEEKILRVLNYIRAHTEFDGQKLTTEEIDLYQKDTVRKLYLFNRAELEFYIRSLFDLGYIRYTPSNDHLFHDLYITTGGISKLIVENEKSSSRDCFVAMSFDSTLRNVYDNAIMPAIKQSGFEPVRVDDDSNIPNELTINDAILAGIKTSKFMIADFTDHKKGVYFEAGYALGRGLKVIYTCREDKISEAHFDTRNYPHIVWKDADDLRKKLIDKIEVFIKA